MTTPFHAKYWAHSLRLARHDGVDAAVIKWLKPGRGVFRIRYRAAADHVPDFVVETDTEKLIC